MQLPPRRKAVFIVLSLYWPGIFILTHIPIIPQWIAQTQLSDKTAHFLAYLGLVFLYWFAISPYNKVNWLRKTVWWTLLVMICYGVLDEWFQGYVGRTPDVRDFLADMGGVATGLIMLSIFDFWPASLLTTGIVILGLTNLSTVNLASIMPRTSVTLHLFAYAFFSILWVQYAQCHLLLQAPGKKWFFVALCVPLGLLAALKLHCGLAGRYVAILDIVAGALGIFGVVFTFYLAAYCRRKCLQQTCK